MEYCTHLYYGTGKGKTTAAVGLAVRAAGAGYRVLFCQFLKSGDTAELTVLEALPRLTVLRPENRYPFVSGMTAEERAAITAEHNAILSRIEDIENTEDAPLLVVLDELAWAWHYDLVDRARVLKLLDAGQAEFVITGRVSVPELLERADYITELREERHPYHRGLAARRGIEQ